MAYRLERELSVGESIRRVVRAEIDEALAELEATELGGHEKVHRARKHCKKIRGALRLVRYALPDHYERENASYRDAARLLSELRDAQSVLECFDGLMREFDDMLDRDAFLGLRRRLAQHRNRAAGDRHVITEPLARVRSRMREGRQRVETWRFDEDGFTAIRAGLLKTYSRGRRALVAAHDKPVTERIHRWRKRVKYHWYQMRLLRPVWKGPLEARCAEADRLADRLGDDHDLSVLRDTILARAWAAGDEQAVQTVIGLISRRQVELRIRARSAGTRLFAERPKAFGERIESYWDAWQAETDSVARVAFRPDLVTA